jgi:uncharacterized membrane protein
LIIAQYFVDFIFYSFLGWVWESIYCTIREKEWQDRGFLFGPICPIYGSCIIAVRLLFTNIEALASPDLPVWVIFLICMSGSAAAEFSTSWVLEKRFHALWWDYNSLPFNIQGRICLPVSASFGLAGVVIVRYLFPFLDSIPVERNPVVTEILALVFALILGADIALTEASLSSLLQHIENFRTEFNSKAEVAYSTVSEAPRLVATKVAETPVKVSNLISDSKEAAASALSERESSIKDMASRYAGMLNASQKRILHNIRKFRPSRENESAGIGQRLKDALKSFETKDRGN